MAYTKKNIIDSVFNILYKFRRTDEVSIDEDWMSAKIDQIGAELKVKEFAQTGIIDQTWLSDVGLISFHKVTPADNLTVSCDCSIAKTTIPQFISLKDRNGNQDLGLYSLVSVCGKTQYTPRPMFLWSYTPKDNVSSLFPYYWRLNTQLFISNPEVEQLRMIGVLLRPEDGILNNTNTVSSGSLVNGTVYLVRFGQIIYNSVVYQDGDTFTANATAIYAGNGKVYLNSEVASYRDIDPYPASGEMIRQIELEILTKEFNIERQSVIDIRNDSADDTTKFQTS